MTPKDVVDRWNKGWNDNDPNAVDELFSPDFVDHTSAGDVRGLEAFQQRLAGLHAAFGACPFTVEDMIVEGDKVAQRWTMRGTHVGAFLGVAATGKAIELKGVNIFRVANGRIVERWTFGDFLGLVTTLRASAAAT